MGGIPVKPSAVLKLQKGKLYGDQRDRAALEPQPKRNIRPRCPRRFSKDERKSWRIFASALDTYGLLSVANATELELLSTAWTQYIECERRLKEDGDIITFGHKGYKENPWFTAQHKLAQLIDRYCQNLGLSSLGMAKLGSLALRAKKDREKFFDD